MDSRDYIAQLLVALLVLMAAIALASSAPGMEWEQLPNPQPIETRD